MHHLQTNKEKEKEQIKLKNTSKFSEIFSSQLHRSSPLFSVADKDKFRPRIDTTKKPPFLLQP
jgi:hypothetical protein